MKIDLCGAWRGISLVPGGLPQEFAGTVPGCVHTDLKQGGIIGDFFYRDNGKSVRWIENSNFVYERAFSVDEARDGAEIVFEGLDTYARVFLNGLLIGEADDMFVPHVFPAKGLVAGENTLRVVFISPIAMVNGFPERSAAFTCERLYTRRLQCTYFWDWVDRFVTMGIFRPVFLRLPEAREIEDVFISTQAVDEFGALLKAKLTLRGAGKGCYCRLTLRDPDGIPVWEKRRLVVENDIAELIDVVAPRLWWPNGYGEQPLYTFAVDIESDIARVISSREQLVGIRTVRIFQPKDLPGTDSYEACLELRKGPHVSGDNAFWDRNRPDEFSGFILVVNGVRVFCKGANWVPCEPFPSAETEEKIQRLLTLARDAHANMIRVWGGGIFEQDAFYDTCDRLGLMVTQDFLMACGSYPERDDAFLEHLRTEAVFAAKKLRNHPSLVWWTGDNENGMNGDEDMEDYGGRRSALRAIGPVLDVLDPTRAFLPSSPYGGRPYGSITKGTTHNTNYIGEWFSYIRYHDLADYREYFDHYLSRFCAEEPIMGFPSVSSLRRFLTEEDIFGSDESMLRFHTKNNPAPAFKDFQIYDYLCAIAEKLFGKPLCPADRVAQRQYVQYEWIRITMELYRRKKWFSSGLVYWMLNDCWPATGWAIIDYYARPKAAWYAFRRAAQPVIASLEKKDGVTRLFVTTDGRKDISGKARLFVQPFDASRPLCEISSDFALHANESRMVLEGVLPDAGKNALVIAEIKGDGFYDRAWLFEARPQDCAFPTEPPRVISLTDSSVTLQATSYVHAVVLDGECFFEDNYFSMLPGETRTVAFRREGAGKITLRSLPSGRDTIILPE